MKIIFDYQIFFWQRYGGISTYFSNLVKNIVALDNEVKIIAPFYTNELINDNSFLDIVIGHKIKNIPMYTDKLFRISNNILFEYYLKKINPKIVHLTYYDKIFNLNNKKKILTVYDLIHEKFKLNGYGNNNFPKKKALQEADHIICISENTKKDLLDFYKVDEKIISVIYLASNFYHNQEIAITNNSTPTILYVGERSRYKNFYNFIKSVSNSKLLKNKVIINCFGLYPFSKQELILFANEGFNSGIINYIGGNNDVLKKLYLSSTALVYPSLYEGFGLPLLEAMSMGCPVICSNIPVMKEIGGDAVRYFDPNNIDDMTASIEQTIYSERNRKSLIKKGFEKNKNFSWTKCAKETLAIYNNVV